MIASIKGILSYKSISHIIVDVQGIGYRIMVPLSTFYELPEIGQFVQLNIHTHVREDLINLFGFINPKEKEIFQLMVSISGIGPRLAINILSGISADDLTRAISAGNAGKLISVPGVGKKTAERMIVELKDRVVKISAVETVSEALDEPIKKDAISALINLGYKSTMAQKAVDEAFEKCEEEITLELLLTESLKILSG
ncbi:MAG: Holliday junction branch migration protein RuvA [Deltaproteobacteria bacterium]|jgi:Holliday junction DNA helicase RuvA|nr:Holliday junction branch migration protein RuvA [Deltaproteobacteria bacterium]MBN2845998.1 Holliday junction branch migration protein RuvA [Deltaproteobacteria bacterium]